MLRIICLCVEIFAFCKALDYATHPSKNPDILGVYSYEKFFFIIFLIFVGISFQILSRNTKDFKENSFTKKPIIYGLFLISFFYLLHINSNLILGIDFATQFKSLQQWADGTTDKWNTSVFASLENLKTTSETWSFRPPGAMVYYIPFIYLPIPIGETLRFAQFLLCIVVIFSWYKVANIFAVSNKIKILLMIVLGLWLGTLLSFIGNVQLLVTAYSSVFTLLTIKMVNWLKAERAEPYKYLPLLFSLVLFLGAIVWIKLSAVIYTGGLFVYLIFNLIIIAYNNRNKNALLFVSVSSLVASLFFISSFIFLNWINMKHGINIDNVYKQNYNVDPHYQFHWGEYFVETTKFPVVILSLFASWSTFSPLNVIQTLISNALTFLGYFDSIILTFELNPKVIYRSLVGLILSLPIFYLFYKCKNKFGNNYIFFFTIVFIPFLAFAVLANRHGYNYLITGTYNQQYLPFFCLFFLILFFNKIQKHTFLHASIKPLFIFLSLGFFTYSNATKLFINLKDNLTTSSIGNENLSNIFYGADVNKVSNIVNQNRKSLDIPIIFLANTSIPEISVLFKGKITGIPNVSNWCKETTVSLNLMNNKAIIIVDSRLDNDEINIIFDRIEYGQIEKVLDLDDSAKVFLINH